MNARMPELRHCFETAGFTQVRTLLSSGNVVFTTRTASLDRLARRAEKAMQSELGRSFETFIRPARYLRDLIESDPFAEFSFPSAAKCVVTFLRKAPDTAVALPGARDGASILKVSATEVFSVYVPGPKGASFMGVLERTFGKSITTRTLATVSKCALE